MLCFTVELGTIKGFKVEKQQHIYSRQKLIRGEKIIHVHIVRKFCMEFF